MSRLGLRMPVARRVSHVRMIVVWQCGGGGAVVCVWILLSILGLSYLKAEKVKVATARTRISTPIPV